MEKTAAARVKLFGIEIDNLTMEETLSRVQELIASNRPHQHVVVNVNKVIAADRDPALKGIINSCELVNVDGMPLVWLSRLLGRPLKERLTGCDIFLRLLEIAPQKNYGIFLLGATQEVLDLTVAAINRDHPGIRIAGRRNGYWQADEEDAVAAMIRDSQAQILAVAISSPKKERFLGKYLEQMRVPFVMGVGGTFDVIAGKTKRAPLWMQRCGLEWFYRFLQEPRRMFKRYFIDGLSFIGLVFRELAGGVERAV